MNYMIVNVNVFAGFNGAIFLFSFYAYFSFCSYSACIVLQHGIRSAHCALDSLYSAFVFIVLDFDKSFS